MSKGMKLAKKCFALALMLVACQSAIGQGTSDKLLEIEADAVIQTQKDAESRREAALKTNLLDVKALDVTSFYQAQRQVVLRKVTPPTELQKRSQPDAAPSDSRLNPEQLARLQELRERESVSIQLHAYVYDGDHSEITLHYERAKYTVWTNVDFRYLRPIGSFQTKTRDYGYFGMTTTVSSEIEAKRIEQARSMGYTEFGSRWKSPPVHFASEAPEYVMVTDDADEVPEEVYRQLDDLMNHYLEHKADLRVAFQNAEALRAARERHKKAHPPEPPQDVILNYSRRSEQPVR